MIQEYTNQPQFSAWPFWVLELTPEAKNADIDKAARDISSKIQFGIEGADRFETPIGNKQRDDFLIREARSKLQDPAARLLAEFLYVDPTQSDNKPDTGPKMSTEDFYQEFGIALWRE